MQAPTTTTSPPTSRCLMTAYQWNRTWPSLMAQSSGSAQLECMSLFLVRMRLGHVCRSMLRIASIARHATSSAPARILTGCPPRGAALPTMACSMCQLITSLLHHYYIIVFCLNIIYNYNYIIIISKLLTCI